MSARTEPSTSVSTRRHTYRDRLQDRQIRLAWIQTALNGSIECSLTTAFLDRDTPPYIALSYAWGQPERDTEIYIDGEVSYITPNLGSFISQLCRNGRNLGRRFWADAICINQEDKVEKTQQVRLMQEIFRKCSKCFCWLGPALDMDGEGIRLLQTLTTELRDQSPDFVEAQARHDRIFKDLDLPPKGSYPWRGLKSIVRRPWFGRSWIIEECLLPKHVTAFLGHREIDFDILLQFGAICLKLHQITNAMDVVKTDPSIPRPPAEMGANNQVLVLIRRNMNQSRSIYYLRHLTTQFYSYDLRDKVYSTVAFVDRFDSNLIDYTKLTARQLFLHLTKLGLRSNHEREGSKLLCYARGADTSSVSDLPTWALDWHPGKFKNTFEPYFPALADNRSASLSFQDTDVLCITGRVIDRITMIRHQPTKGIPYDLYEAGEDIEYMHVEFLAECERLIRNLSKYPTGQPLAQVIFSAFLNGSTFPSISLAYDANPLIFSQLFDHVSYPSAARVNTNHSRDDTDKAYASFVLAYKPAAAHSFFVSERGYVGFAHENADVGDMVCVVQGCRLPLTLRSAGMRYQLIGDTYLHGCMNNEAHRTSGASWETIEIV